MCVQLKKNRGLYHVPKRRYFNFSPGRFSEIVAILTAPAVSDSVNITARMDGPPVAVEMACRRNITQSFTRSGKIWRFLKPLAIAKTWFSIRKIFHMLVWSWRYGKTVERSNASWISDRASGFMLPMAGFHRRTCNCRHLPRAFETACGPLGLKAVSWHKIHLFADSAPAYIAKTSQRLLA